MNEALHPAASQHLPAFITAPGDTDVLMIVMSFILLLAVLGFGILFLRLHTLPERIAHKSHKLQFEIVAVLGLVALFTHMHIFWIVGLLLALIDIPDFSTPLNRIAGSAEKIARIEPEGDIFDGPAQSIAGNKEADETARIPTEVHSAGRHDDAAAAPLPAKAETVISKQQERIHA